MNISAKLFTKNELDEMLSGYSWIKVKRYDASLSLTDDVVSKYNELLEHHKNETEFLVEKCREFAKELFEERYKIRKEIRTKDLNLNKRELMRLNVAEDDCYVYPSSELTRVRVWETKPDSSYYFGTLLERLNGIRHYNENGEISTIEVNPLYGETRDIDDIDKALNSFDILLKNVSHTISNIVLEDNVLYGDIKILNTHKGKMLENMMLEFGDAIVFNPICTGIVDKDKVITELDIITFNAQLR